jgi:starch phosphorylase
MMIVASGSNEDTRTIAYFSMEIGLEAGMPTYSGGLGVLSGDTLRAAADLGVPMVAVSLLHRQGYFRQHLDAFGNQTEEPYKWSPEEFLEPLPNLVKVAINGELVHFHAWRYIVRGVRGHTIPVYLLDTALPENSEYSRSLTDYLYGGDTRYRLCQEVLLGIGGVDMLTDLGYSDIQTCHMNEGHSALLTLALLRQQMKDRDLRQVTRIDVEAVRRKCVFTTHTPVPAGHDQFPFDMVLDVLGEERTRAMEMCECMLDGTLNMTYLGLFFSRYVNGVSLRHEQVSRDMFPGYPVDAITNGVHAVTWTSTAFRSLFDNYLPEWRHDNRYLRYAVSIPLQDIRKAHKLAKAELIRVVEERTGVKLQPSVMTIGFARRSTPYKRGDLIFTDMERLRRVVNESGPIQIVYGGKAHPRDGGGKDVIRRIHRAAEELRDEIKIVYLEEYDMAVGKVVCAGVDLWLNTPMKPREASGTSGMKAALNGVPSLSVLDGWWVEGHEEGVTGWSIGNGWHDDSIAADEAASMYEKLEYLILPMFYNRPNAFARVMRSCISHNGSFFNAQRMVDQYRSNAYQVPELV